MDKRQAQAAALKQAFNEQRGYSIATAPMQHIIDYYQYMIKATCSDPTRIDSKWTSGLLSATIAYGNSIRRR